MPERQDHTSMDYMYGLPALSNPVGDRVPLSDTWGWSVTLACINGAKGTLYFNFGDFDSISGLYFPFNAAGAVGQDVLSIVATSGPTYWRLGKAYDSLFNTAKWMRMYWSDGGSTAQSTIYVSLTLKHQ